MTLKMWEAATWIKDVSLKIWKVAASDDSSRVVHSTSAWSIMSIV